MAVHDHHQIAPAFKTGINLQKNIHIDFAEKYVKFRVEIFKEEFMPAKTLHLSNILDISENLYEAAIIIAKRSRQINEELYQKKRDRQILEELEGGFDEDFLPGEPEEAETPEEIESEENPLVHAYDEFINKEIDFHYEPVR